MGEDIRVLTVLLALAGFRDGCGAVRGEQGRRFDLGPHSLFASAAQPRKQLTPFMCNLYGVTNGARPCAGLTKPPGAAKTVAQCDAQYAANTAAIRASGQTKRAFVAACRAGNETIPQGTAAAPVPAPAPALSRCDAASAKRQRLRNCQASSAPASPSRGPGNGILRAETGGRIQAQNP
jgi:hypothetical protein